ncbi:hypothetical protein C8J57DRAFT_1459542 [Mycena rebaudengoi]|nr:hypothetical protein C8J57DRAFT_1459542 [Mycena rebaudengoi]
MRAPRSLEDTTLLLEEPFASSFTGGEDITKTALLALFQKTAKKVQAAPGGPEAAAAWLNMAFEANPRDQRRFSSRASRELRIAISFVRFYWCLYSQQDTKRLLHALPLPGYKPKQGQTSITHDKAKARNAKMRDAPSTEPTSPLSEASNDKVDEDPSYAYPLHKKESLSASIRSVSVRSDRDSKPKPAYAESPARHLSSLATTSPERRLSHTLTTPERSPPARRPVWPPAHLRPSTVLSDSPEVKPMLPSPPSPDHMDVS